jgi:hypothetical protein
MVFVGEHGDVLDLRRVLQLCLQVLNLGRELRKHAEPGGNANAQHNQAGNGGGAPPAGDAARGRMGRGFNHRN